MLVILQLLVKIIITAVGKDRLVLAVGVLDTVKQIVMARTAKEEVR